LLKVTEKSSNLRNYLRQDIVHSVSTLRNTFVNLKNNEEENITRIQQLEGELNKAKAGLGNRVSNLEGRGLPSRGGSGVTFVQDRRNFLPRTGRAKKLYSEAVNSTVDRRFKLLVKSKHNHPTEEIKNALKTSVNPKDISVGIKTFKSMKDGRVLIEAGTQEEINVLSFTIIDKCGEDMEVTIPKLRKPSMIIRNVPQDISVENIEKILDQTPELDMTSGDIDAWFKFRTKRGHLNMIGKVGSET
jgi:hypothetical protein